MPDDAKFCNTCGEKLESNDSLSINANESSQTSAYVEDVTIQDMFLKTTGRLNRLRYLKRSIVRVLALFAVIIIICLMFQDYYGNFLPVGEVFLTISIILFIVPSYCLDVRRLQDMNEKKDCAVANAIIMFFIVILTPDDIRDAPVIVRLLGCMSTVITLRLMFKDGTHGRNDYGADPLNR